MSTQQALFLEKPKGDFVVNTRDIPTPPAGEILIKIHATALNPVDWKIQKYAAFIKNYPAILGTDLAGEVEALGDGVTKFKKGDRILAQGYFTNDRATFQQYTLIPERFIAKIPESLAFDQAATIPVAFLAAVTGLFGGKGLGAGLNPDVEWPAPQQKDQTIVIIGGSSSVGQYAIQLSKFLGFSTIVAYASKKHHALLADLGATQLVDRAAVPLEKLDTAVSGPAKIVYDAVASAESQEIATKIVSTEGAVITVGEDKRSEKPADKTFLNVFGSSFAPGHEVFGEKLWAKVGRLLEEKIIRPNRLEVIPGGLNGIVSGLKRLENNEISGEKLVVRPQETET
ncbi:GroES-like protein [Cylindrobasidium torrendii FP15055 ss-10]|uniref:GroES-like protein n=1 Tax=Cylindrobasidium torrendii FP15055 ss-10 TaxID=1314674 RepID=A0A0D7B5N2_9AGAR|nr:GroES-like protein [Cylindrobasidium torrendii FP15055 ss-10]